MLVFISKDDAATVTWPGGWNILTQGTANTFYMGIGWRRASSEPANYTWNFASQWVDALILSYQGVGISTTPTDPDTPPAIVEQATVTSLATNNMTTTTTDTVAVVFGNQKAIITWGAAPGSYVARQNAGANETFVMDQAFTTPQTITGPTVSTAGGTPTGPMKVYILGLQSAADDQHYNPPPVFPGVFNLDARRMI